MPLYEFRCQKCETAFEALLFNGEHAECPECHGHKLERQLSLPAKPRSDAASLPMAACNADAPPCGPGCCRL